MQDFSQFELITFDCYGTLIDWEKGMLAAFRYAARDPVSSIADGELLSAYAEAEAQIEAGGYLPYREVLGRSSEAALARFGIRLEDLNRGFLAASVAQWAAFPDSVDALRRLRQQFRLGVISNIDRDLFAASNARLGGPFTYVVTAEDVGAYKPSLLNFKFAERITATRREKWLHVAQSLYHDIRPCNELGIACVWINRYGVGQGAVKQSLAAPDATFSSLAGFADEACR